MDRAMLILNESVPPPVPLEQFATQRSNSVTQEQKRQAAKDFESVLLNKLLDIMNTTIGDWGFENDSAFKQVQGIFCMYLARDVASNGGLGLWKDIYQILTSADDAKTAGQSLEGQI